MIGVGEGRLRLGVLTPHAAAGPEIEIRDMSRGRVAVAVARIRPPEGASRTETGPTTVQSLRALTRADAIDRAAACLDDHSVDAVAHASTTTGYILGARSEAALLERLGSRCAVPAVGSTASVAEALRAFGANRLILVHPPWFDAELDQMGVSYFRQLGFGVALLKATGLLRDPGRVRSEHVIDWVSRHLEDGDEAVFLAGNGFRAARAVAELEERTSRLVLQANQVLLWSAVAATHAHVRVLGYGRLFETLPRPTT